MNTPEDELNIDGGRRNLLIAGAATVASLSLPAFAASEVPLVNKHLEQLFLKLISAQSSL